MEIYQRATQTEQIMPTKKLQELAFSGFFPERNFPTQFRTPCYWIFLATVGSHDFNRGPENSRMRFPHLKIANQSTVDALGLRLLVSKKAISGETKRFGGKIHDHDHGRGHVRFHGHDHGHGYGPRPMVHGPWSKNHAPWSMDKGPSTTVHGSCTMDHGPWTIHHGPWTMVHVPWAMDHAPRSMVHGL